MIKKLTYLLSGVTLVTLFSGSIVAGNDAGFICNTWPKINEKFVPDEFTPLKTGLNGFMSDPVIIQFNHRSMAYLTSFSSLALAFATFKSKNLPPKIKVYKIVHVEKCYICSTFSASTGYNWDRHFIAGSASIHGRGTPFGSFICLDLFIAFVEAFLNHKT